VRNTVRLSNLQAAVEVEINAAIPELRAAVAKGVRAAIAKTDIARLAQREAQEVLNEIIMLETRMAISECADDIARNHIKSATKDAVESLFRQWIASNAGKPLPV